MKCFDWLVKTAEADKYSPLTFRHGHSVTENVLVVQYFHLILCKSILSIASPLYYPCVLIVFPSYPPKVTPRPDSKNYFPYNEAFRNWSVRVAIQASHSSIALNPDVAGRYLHCMERIGSSCVDFIVFKGNNALDSYCVRVIWAPKFRKDKIMVCSIQEHLTTFVNKQTRK